MTTKADIQSAVQALADAASNLDLRVGFGTPGNRIAVRNETLDTGQAWGTETFLEVLTGGIAAAMDARGGKLTEEYFTASGGQTTRVLGQLPVTASGAHSGYDMLVFKDGVLMTYTSGTPSTPYEYAFASSTRTLSWVAADGSFFFVRYRV